MIMHSTNYNDVNTRETEGLNGIDLHVAFLPYFYFKNDNSVDTIQGQDGHSLPLLKTASRRLADNGSEPRLFILTSICK